MSDSFVKADSRNLPKVENVMILEYIASSSRHSLAEIRGAIILMSSQDSYINTAVGYVKVCRTGSNCKVNAKIVPKHRISKKLYSVTCKIDEQNDIIVNSTCDDCAASAGGCKHSLLLLFWLAIKSSEPSSTAVECYWSKPALSTASTQPVTSKEIFTKTKVPKLIAKDETILQNFLEECQRRRISNSLILKFGLQRKSSSKNIFDIVIRFVHEEVAHDYSNFREYLNKVFSDEIITQINVKTRGQSESKYWHTICQGRLTASKLYEADEL